MTLRSLIFTLSLFPLSISGQEPPSPDIEQEIASPETETENTPLQIEQEKTRTFLQQEQEALEKATNLQNQTKNAEPTAEKLADSLLLPIQEPELPPLDQIDLAEAERKEAELTATLKTQAEAIEGLQREEEAADQRQAELPDQLAALRMELAELQNSQPPTPDDPALAKAMEEQFLAQERALQARINALQAEQESFSPLATLRVQKERAAVRELERLQTKKAAWDKILEQKYAARTTEAKNLAEAHEARFQDIPALSQLTSETAELARKRSEIRHQSAQLSEFQDEIRALRTTVQEQRTAAEERLQLLASADLPIDTQTGNLLRTQRAGLPTSSELTSKLRGNIQVATNAQLQRIELNRASRTATRDLSEQVEKLSAQIKQAGVSETEIRELFLENLRITNELLAEYRAYILALQETNSETRTAISEVENYSRYLDERLLWIPSAPPISFRDLEVEASAFRDLFSPHHGGTWLATISQDALANPFKWLGASLILAALLIRRRRWRKTLQNLGTLANRRHCLSLNPTLQATAVTVLLALPIPLILGFLAWRSGENVALSHSLRDAALVLLLGRLLRVMARPEGLLISHFGLNPERVRLLRIHLAWLVPSATVLRFLTTALPEISNDPAAGRLVFLAMMALAMTGAHLLFQPAKGLIHQVSGKTWLPKVVHLLSLAIPLAFSVGFLAGYLTSVRTLWLQVIDSVGIILFAIFVGAFLVRWILVVRRRFAREHAVKKFLAERAAKKTPEEGKIGESGGEQATLEEVEANAIDIVSVEEQTTKLVRVGLIVLVSLGLWNVWSTSLPALSFLDQVTLWSSEPETKEASKPTQQIDGFLAPGEGTKEEKPALTESSGKRLSLQDVFAAIVVLILTFIASRNLPGLLELSILRRLSLQPGGNYAVTTMLRYVIVAIGIVIALQLVGLTWGSVQWLAAAVSLGIGFGLQEIFANFVAGIILLFERPIRLGDIVTVGDVSGRVTQIQIRATRILQFNGRELIVPNKQFITSELVNWTLTDSKLRFDFQVGVSYESDVEKVKDTLQDILNSHPNILEDPAPVVVFIAFGNSTLDFEVRAHVESPAYIVDVPSQIHFETLRRFREEGIEIAFPQTDIHLRTLPVDPTENQP